MASRPGSPATPKKAAPKKAAPKKSATGKRAAPEGVVVETLLNNALVKVTRTTIQPGAAMPPLTRGADYVLLPVTDFTCVRRHMRNGKVTREVTVNAVSGKPYLGRAIPAGTVIELANTGSTVAVFDKVVLKRATSG
jgi:hypothetical protein